MSENDKVLLKIRSLIADKEFNTALANRELANGGWTYDHQHEHNCIDAEIVKLFKQLEKPK
jgi:hypothetical protein